MHPSDPVGFVLSELFGDRRPCSFDGVFRHGEDVDLGDVVIEERVGNPEANAMLPSVTMVAFPERSKHSSRVN